MEERKIDTKENCEWYQFKHQIYFKKRSDISINDISGIKEVKRENRSDFQKLGGIFDIAFYKNEFVLCRNRDFTEAQELVSFRTMNLDFGICQQIPYRGMDIINDETVLNIVRNENNAINIINQFKYGKIYYGEIKNKIYLYFGNNINLDLSYPLHKKGNNTFLNKLKLDTNNHDVSYGWHPLGYPYHLGFINETLVIFKDKTDEIQECIEVEHGKIIEGIPKSLDETCSWHMLSKIPRLTLVTMIEKSKKKLPLKKRSSIKTADRLF